MNRNGNTTSLELDAMTARLLVHIAETWGVSAEEAIRRALEQANAKTDSPNKEARLEAFKELQRRLDLSPAKAAEWQEAVREARR
jgi:hypothetical protein